MLCIIIYFNMSLKTINEYFQKQIIKKTTAEHPFYFLKKAILLHVGKSNKGTLTGFDPYLR